MAVAARTAATSATTAAAAAANGCAITVDQAAGVYHGRGDERRLGRRRLEQKANRMHLVRHAAYGRRVVNSLVSGRRGLLLLLH